MNNAYKEALLLTTLAALLEEFDATLTYSADDDGIVIFVKGKEVFRGFLDGKGGTKALREKSIELLIPTVMEKLDYE